MVSGVSWREEGPCCCQFDRLCDILICLKPLNMEPCEVTILTRVDGKFGKGVKNPVFNVECGAELEGWRKCIKRRYVS